MSAVFHLVEQPIPFERPGLGDLIPHISCAQLASEGADSKADAEFSARDRDYAVGRMFNLIVEREGPVNAHAWLRAVADFARRIP